MGWLYMLLFPNGKVYIGQTVVSLAQRWRQHKLRALDPKRQHAVLYHGWRKHGAPEFIPLWEVPREGLGAAEIALIRTLNCQHPNGYNTTPGGDFNPMGTPAGREAVARSKRGVKRGPRSAEWQEKIAASRRFPMTPEHKAKIAAALKGKPKSAAHVAAMRKARSKL